MLEMRFRFIMRVPVVMQSQFCIGTPASSWSTYLA